MFYAVINENNICTEVKMTSGVMLQENHIEIPSMDTIYLYHKYEGGSWSTEKYEPVSTAPLSEFEQLKAENESTKQALAELTLFISTMNGGM